jgi:hypothetical protein
MKWIRGYFSASEKYIDAKRNNDKSRKQWTYVRELYEKTSRLENVGQLEYKLTDEDLKEFLGYEGDLDVTLPE